MTFVVCAAAMPPACAIAHGIGFGFIVYMGVRTLAGCVWDIRPADAIPGDFVCAQIRPDQTAWGACDSA
ncbi:xanthine/uracil/vitamin C permease (AzgA family) [Inquilinus ginsengisoli]|uniref:hypothetical protein n=1 Tax=Inquilinus ginsengisoli TaxID=363840 RepID=UPI003D1F5F4B